MLASTQGTLCQMKTQSSLPNKGKGGGAPPPNFRPISIVPKWLDASRCHSVWRQASDQASLCQMGTQPPPQKGGRAPSPILRVEVRISKLDRKCGALPVVANFVALEQQIILVKTRSESAQKWRRYKRQKFCILRKLGNMWSLSD